LAILPRQQVKDDCGSTPFRPQELDNTPKAVLLMDHGAQRFSQDQRPKKGES
jgi:hypothetical protein